MLSVVEAVRVVPQAQTLGRSSLRFINIMVEWIGK